MHKLACFLPDIYVPRLVIRLQLSDNFYDFFVFCLLRLGPVMPDIIEGDFIDEETDDGLKLRKGFWNLIVKLEHHPELKELIWGQVGFFIENKWVFLAETLKYLFFLFKGQYAVVFDYVDIDLEFESILSDCDLFLIKVEGEIDDALLSLVDDVFVEEWEGED